MNYHDISGLKQFLKLKDPLANYRQDRYKVAENIASTLREDPTCVEDKETEEESREKARQRSFMRAKRQNEPLRRTTGYPKRHFERAKALTILTRARNVPRQQTNKTALIL